MKLSAILMAALLTLLLGACRFVQVSPTPTAVVNTRVAPTTAASVKRPSPPATTTLSPTAQPTTAPTVAATALPSATPTPTPDFPRYDGQPLRSDAIGYQVHIHREDMGEIMRQLEDLGAGWVKVQVSWKLYEPEIDSYSAERLAELDTLVSSANERGIKVLLSVSKAPEWSRVTTEMDGPPQDYDRYRRFMSFLAARYAGRVAAYELWNEPNLQREWNGAPLSAADLTDLIAAGASGVRAADPAALVISAAPATTGIDDGVVAIDDRRYLRGMLEANIGDVVDGIGVHPYGWANPPDSTNAAQDSSAPSHNDHPSFFFGDTLTDYGALLDEFGITDPLWLTEFGWGSFDGLVDDEGVPARPPGGAEFMSDISEWQQATYLLRALELGQANDRIGPMIVWNLNFGPLLGSDYSESGYSILRPDGSRRPAYRALRFAKKA